MTRRRRVLARSIGSLGVALAIALLLHGWFAPDNVLSLWSLVAWCG